MLIVRNLGGRRAPGRLGAALLHARWHEASTPRQRQVAETSNSNVVRSPFSDVSIPEMNLSEFVWRNSDRWKNKPAMTCGLTGRSYTYGEARAAAERLSLSLPASAGLRPGDTLGLVLPNSPEFPVTLLGAAAAGLIVSPANPVYTAEELARQFSNSGARAVVTTPDLLDKVVAAVDAVPGGAQIIVATDGGGAEEAALAARGGGLLSLHELMRKEYSRRTPRAPRVDPGSLVALPYSSGTTGLPKGVKISHRNMVANICQSEHPDISPDNKCMKGEQDVSLCVLPFFHIYGLNGILTVNLSQGCHNISLPSFDPASFSSAFKQYKPTMMSLVPPLLMFVTNTDKIAPHDLARLRSVVCGAAPATKPVIEKFLQKVNNSNLDFREGYGMTETSCMVLYMPYGRSLNKVGSCGVPVPLTEIKVVDESGEALSRGREGELLIRGPQVMQGYHNNEQTTRDTLSEDGWLSTGDVAYVDDEGFVFIVDRLKELIKVKGLQVSPTELEGVVRQLEGVTDVAVVGVPDDRAGEVPRAFVVRRDASLTENDVAAHVERHVAPFKRLAGGVRFVKEIPKNAGGKTLRKALKELE